MAPGPDRASPPPRPRWYTHSYDGPRLYQMVAVCAPRIPRVLRFACARTLADMYRQRMPKEYAAAQRNIAHILPTADPATISQVARSLFRHFAYYFADLLSLNRQPLPTIQHRYLHGIHNFDRVQPLLASRQGFVVATAHLGNWELAGRLLSPYGKTVNVLIAPEQYAEVQRLLREEHRPPSLRFVSNEDTGGFVQLLMALRRGEIVAVQVDRGTGHRSDVPVNFFGLPVSLPAGPFMLARAAQVPVLPCFCVMRPDRRYEIYIGESIAVERGDEAKALQQMAHVLEQYIALAPDQWFNFYDVWDTPSATR
jgi:lauroyl/myristoyl acyltransferase